MTLDENENPRVGEDGEPLKINSNAKPKWPPQCHTFLKDKNDNGEIKQAQIIELMEKDQAMVESDPRLIKFKIKFDKDKFEEILAYKMDCISLEDTGEDGENKLWNYWRRIISHEGPLYPSHRNYMLFCERREIKGVRR